MVSEDVYQKAVRLVEQNRGKLAITSKITVNNLEELSAAYTPGVAAPCRLIHKNPELQYAYTARGSLVAVVTDGTAVLGLGNVGPEAALVVMEGKAIMLKAYADIDAFPLCLATTDVDEIVATVKILEPTFGAIHLEDISAPRCFEVEERLQAELSIPVFHDDQHGTAIAAAAGLVNALKVVKKEKEAASVVINGAGAAGIATAKLLLTMGFQDIVLCDRSGAIYQGRQEGMNKYKAAMAPVTNHRQVKTLEEALQGADVFIGVSTGNVLKPAMVRAMSSDPIVFALANPDPEIRPEEARLAGAAVIATGRSDYPNLVNNLLAFPGVIRGALDVRASRINDAMKVAAVYAIASRVNADRLGSQCIMPDVLDKETASVVAKAVADAAIRSGVAKTHYQT